MSRRLMLAVAAIAAFGLLSTSAVGAKKPQIKVLGKTTFKANKFIKDNQRFKPGTVKVKSGSTVSFVNKAKTQDPHSISLVSAFPTKVEQLFECEECMAIEESHGFGPEGPENPVVDGGDGFNAPGDSILFGPGERGSFDVTADPGTTLRYLCIVHPWMQGKIKVR